MDVNNIILVGSGVLFSIGTVAAGVVKVLPKVMKYVHVAAHATKILEDIGVALAPDASKGETKPVLTQDECAKILQDIQDFKAALKA